jgi:two-component system response regulator (stage 0 sporulation protein F)
MDEKIKILYVDDESFNLLIFESLFENKYEVITAELGDIGLEILKSNLDIRLVVSDMRMPLMDGIEFITKAKALYPQIHYFILSGYDITPKILEALSSGLIVNYFQKPFEASEIEASFDEVLLNNVSST